MVFVGDDVPIGSAVEAVRPRPTAKLVKSGATRDLLRARATLDLVVSRAALDSPGSGGGHLDLVARVAREDEEAGGYRSAHHRDAATSRAGSYRSASVAHRIGSPARHDRDSVRLAGLPLDAELTTNHANGRRARDLRHEQPAHHNADCCSAPANHDGIVGPPARACNHVRGFGEVFVEGGAVGSR